MQYTIHEYGPYEMEQSVKAGLIRKGKFADKVTAERISIACQGPEPVPPKDEEKERFHWIEW